MKYIDEKEILLAVGDVGDDLLLRAEKTAVQLPHRRHWYALAACFCLVAALAVFDVLPSFRMGSMAPEGNGADTALETSGQANVLEQMWGSAAIVQVELAAVEDGLKAESDEMEKGCSSMADSESEAARQSECAAYLTAQLRAAKVIAAQEDTEQLHFTLKAELLLDSGERAEALCDVQRAVVQLNGYHFYCEDLSILDGKEHTR